MVLLRKKEQNNKWGGVCSSVVSSHGAWAFSLNHSSTLLLNYFLNAEIYCCKYHVNNPVENQGQRWAAATFGNKPIRSQPWGTSSPALQSQGAQHTWLGHVGCKKEALMKSVVVCRDGAIAGRSGSKPAVNVCPLSRTLLWFNADSRVLQFVHVAPSKTYSWRCGWLLEATPISQLLRAAPVVPSVDHKVSWKNRV